MLIYIAYFNIILKYSFKKKEKIWFLKLCVVIFSNAVRTYNRSEFGLTSQGTYHNYIYNCYGYESSLAQCSRFTRGSCSISSKFTYQAQVSIACSNTGRPFWYNIGNPLENFKTIVIICKTSCDCAPWPILWSKEETDFAPPPSFPLQISIHVFCKMKHLIH